VQRRLQFTLPQIGPDVVSFPLNFSICIFRVWRTPRSLLRWYPAIWREVGESLWGTTAISTRPTELLMLLFLCSVVRVFCSLRQVRMDGAAPELLPHGNPQLQRMRPALPAVSLGQGSGVRGICTEFICSSSQLPYLTTSNKFCKVWRTSFAT
jgi:hypothetical protein